MTTAEPKPPSTTKPMLLLDVDGVLCPFEGEVPVTRRVGPAGYKRVPLSGDLHERFLWVSEDNAERLRRLSEVFDLVWATGWRQEANRVIGPLHQLHELPVVEVEMSSSVTWKLPSISAYVGDERPVAWIDDDLGEDAREWARRRAAPTLLVACDPHVGLTAEVVERCLEFASGVQRP